MVSISFQFFATSVLIFCASLVLPRILDEKHSHHPGLECGSTSNNRHEHFTFKIYWGLACKCSEIGIDLGLSKWGILANQNISREQGDVFNAFHKSNFDYPYIDENGAFVNGGVPQARKLSKRLEIATLDIIKKIPNTTFNGLVVIDWEKWFPYLNLIKNTVYRNASIELVRQRIHNFSNETIEMLAGVEFDQASKGLMEGVLRLGKTLRPQATWGFYHYPYCDNKQSKTGYSCSKGIIAGNDKMTWLFDESSALLPSIYIRPYIKDNYNFVDARLKETLRTLGNLKEPGKPVYVYNRFNYSHTGLYYNIGDIKMSVGKAASLSFDGIILWGDKMALSNKVSCTQLKKLLASTYGPVLLNTKIQAESCSQKMCSGYGRCILNDTLLSNTDGHVFWKWQTLEFIKCRCLTGWTGDDCSTRCL